MRVVGGSELEVTVTTQESELLVAQRSEREDVGESASRNYFPIIKLMPQKAATLFTPNNHPFVVLPFRM